MAVIVSHDPAVCFDFRVAICKHNVLGVGQEQPTAMGPKRSLPMGGTVLNIWGLAKTVPEVQLSGDSPGIIRRVMKPACLEKRKAQLRLVVVQVLTKPSASGRG